MASEADSLRLVAEVQDRFSEPLKRMQSMLRGISENNRLKGLKQDFDGVHKAASKVSTEVKNVLAPALASVGVAGLSVSGALLGIGAALRSFAGNTASLSLLSREVGISANKLRELGALGSHFGLDEGTMQGAVRTFSQHLRDMRLGYGDTLNWLSQQGRNGTEREIFKNFALDLNRSKDNAEALEKALEFLQRVPDAVERGTLAERLFGNRSLGLLGTEDIKKVLEEIRRAHGKALGPEAERNAFAFSRGIEQVQNQLRGLRDAIASNTLPEINKMVEGLREFFDENRQEISDTLATSIRELGTALRETDWKSIGGGLLFFLKEAGQFAGSAAKAIEAVAKAINSFKNGDILQGIKELDRGTAFRPDYKPTPEEQRRSDQGRLGDAQRRRDAMDSWLRENGGGSGPMLDGMRAKRKALDDEIRQLQERLNSPASSGAPGQKLGALEQKQTLEEGTKKGVLAALREFAFARAAEKARDGAPKVEPAAYGGSARAPGGGTGGVPPRYAPDDVGRAPGVPETRKGLEGLRPGPGGEDSAGPGGDPILDMISGAEGTKKRGYNDFFGHRNVGDLTNMTLNEILALQDRSPRNRKAAGKYQFMPNTLREEMRKLGLSGDEKFTPEMQDRLARSRLRYRGYEAWKAGRMSDQQFMHELSKEWAGLTDPRTGRGYYPGQTTGHPLARQFEALRRERSRLAERESTPGSTGLRGQWPSMWRDKTAGGGDQPAWGGGFDAFKGAYDRRGLLLDRAREAGLGGSEVNANGTIHVHVDGPKGTRVRTRNEGDLFKDVHLHRGSSAAYGTGEDV